MSDSNSTPEMIEVCDPYGRTFKIPREEWRTKVLPGILKENWNKADGLYSVIAEALRDGFAEELLDAARHLEKIDPRSIRGALLIGAIFYTRHRYEEAEKTFERALKKYGDDGYLLSNLARVYAAQGKGELYKQTMWRSLELDPNQANSILWYGAIAHEHGGDTEEQVALEKIAELPNSWRVHLWLARRALAHKEVTQAKQHYDKVFALVQPVPADALGQMSGDLGNAGYVSEIVQIVVPHYKVEQHGIATGNNILKAYLDLHRPQDARKLLDRLFSQQRSDWLPTLNYWERELARLTPTTQVADADTKNQISLLSIEGPIWTKQNEQAQGLLPAKSKDALKFAFVAGSAQFRQGTGDDEDQPQSYSAIGKLTRGLPLLLSERVHLNTGAIGTCLFPWLEGRGFILSGSDKNQTPFSPNLAITARYWVILNVSAESEPWDLSLRLLDSQGGMQLGEWVVAINPSDCGATIQKVIDDFISHIEVTLCIPSEKNGVATDIESAWIPYYFVALEQALAVYCSSLWPDMHEFLHAERSILDGMFELCLSQDGSIPARLLLMSTMQNLKKTRPEIVREYYERLELLQGEKRITGAGSDIILAIYTAVLLEEG